MSSYLFNNESKIDENILKECNFDARLLLAKGYTINALKNVDFDSEALRIAGISAIQLRCNGFTINQLKEGGFTVII